MLDANDKSPAEEPPKDAPWPEKRGEERPTTGEAPFDLDEVFFSRTDERGVILTGNYLPGVFQELIEAGIDVVEDRCTLAVHRRHRIEPHRP